MSCILPEFLFLQSLSQSSALGTALYQKHLRITPYPGLSEAKVQYQSLACQNAHSTSFGSHRVEMQSILSTEKTLSGKQSTSEKLSSAL